MKKAYKQYDIEDPIYKAMLSVFVGNLDEIKKHLLKCGFPDYGDVSAAKYIAHERMKAIILTDTSITTIAHEVIHFCFHVFEQRGIPITQENDDVFAYYFEMMFSKIIKALKKRRN